MRLRQGLPRDQWPTILQQYPECEGVYVEGCVTRGKGSSFRASAHAHTEGRYADYLCFRGQNLHKPMLVLHELAHLLQPGGHTDKWRAKLLEIGGTLDPVEHQCKSYQKVSRG